MGQVLQTQIPQSPLRSRNTPNPTEEHKSLKAHQGAENPKAHPRARVGLVQPCTGSRNPQNSLGFPTPALLLPATFPELGEAHFRLDISIFFFIFPLEKKKKQKQPNALRHLFPSAAFSLLHPWLLLTVPLLGAEPGKSPGLQSQGSLQASRAGFPGEQRAARLGSSTNSHLPRMWLPNFGGTLETASCLLQSCLAAPPPR